MKRIDYCVMTYQNWLLLMNVFDKLIIKLFIINTLTKKGPFLIPIVKVETIVIYFYIT